MKLIYKQLKRNNFHLSRPVKYLLQQTWTKIKSFFLQFLLLYKAIIMYSFVPNTYYKYLKQTPSINYFFLCLENFEETFQTWNYTKRFSIKMYKFLTN